MLGEGDTLYRPPLILRPLPHSSTESAVIVRVEASRKRSGRIGEEIHDMDVRLLWLIFWMVVFGLAGVGAGAIVSEFRGECEVRVWWGVGGACAGAVFQLIRYGP